MVSAIDTDGIFQDRSFSLLGGQRAVRSEFRSREMSARASYPNTARIFASASRVCVVARRIKFSRYSREPPA